MEKNKIKNYEIKKRKKQTHTRLSEISLKYNISHLIIYIFQLNLSKDKT